MRATGDRISGLEDEARDVENNLRDLMLVIPNLPLDDVPDGLDESFNVIERAAEPPPERDWDTPHWDIGERTGHHRHGGARRTSPVAVSTCCADKARGCTARLSVGF